MKKFIFFSWLSVSSNRLHPIPVIFPNNWLPLPIIHPPIYRFHSYEISASHKLWFVIFEFFQKRQKIMRKQNDEQMMEKKHWNLSSTQIYLIIADNSLSTIDHENVPRNKTKATKKKQKKNVIIITYRLQYEVIFIREERKTNNKITKFRDESMYLNIESNKSKILCIKKKSQCLSMQVFSKSIQWLLFRWTVDWSFLLSFWFKFVFGFNQTSLLYQSHKCSTHKFWMTIKRSDNWKLVKQSHWFRSFAWKRNHTPKVKTFRIYRIAHWIQEGKISIFCCALSAYRSNRFTWIDTGMIRNKQQQQHVQQELWNNMIWWAPSDFWYDYHAISFDMVLFCSYKEGWVREFCIHICRNVLILARFHWLKQSVHRAHNRIAFNRNNTVPDKPFEMSLRPVGWISQYIFFEEKKNEKKNPTNFYDICLYKT